jgi:hypothetical protein
MSKEEAKEEEFLDKFIKENALTKENVLNIQPLDFLPTISETEKTEITAKINTSVLEYIKYKTILDNKDIGDLLYNDRWRQYAIKLERATIALKNLNSKKTESNEISREEEEAREEKETLEKDKPPEIFTPESRERIRDELNSINEKLKAEKKLQSDSKALSSTRVTVKVPEIKVPEIAKVIAENIIEGSTDVNSKFNKNKFGGNVDPICFTDLFNLNKMGSMDLNTLISYIFCSSEISKFYNSEDDNLITNDKSSIEQQIIQKINYQMNRDSINVTSTVFMMDEQNIKKQICCGDIYKLTLPDLFYDNLKTTYDYNDKYIIFILCCQLASVYIQSTLICLENSSNLEITDYENSQGHQYLNMPNITNQIFTIYLSKKYIEVILTIRYLGKEGSIKIGFDLSDNSYKLLEADLPGTLKIAYQNAIKTKYQKEKSIEAKLSNQIIEGSGKEYFTNVKEIWPEIKTISDNGYTYTSYVSPDELGNPNKAKIDEFFRALQKRKRYILDKLNKFTDGVYVYGVSIRKKNGVCSEQDFAIPNLELTPFLKKQPAIQEKYPDLIEYLKKERKDCKSLLFSASSTFRWSKGGRLKTRKLNNRKLKSRKTKRHRKKTNRRLQKKQRKTHKK